MRPRIGGILTIQIERDPQPERIGEFYPLGYIVLQHEIAAAQRILLRVSSCEMIDGPLQVTQTGYIDALLAVIDGRIVIRSVFDRLARSRKRHIAIVVGYLDG